MPELQRKPDIRFDGFDEAWEQRKLGNHTEILTGGTPHTSVLEYWEPKEIPWLSSGEVNKKRINSTDNMISKKGLDNSSARWVKEYSILIALAGQGKTRGTVAINNISLTTNQSIAAIVPDATLYYEFVFQDLIRRYDELRMLSSGDGTRGGLNKQLVSDVLITCPNVEEQIKIGSFLASLDRLITLHQREHDKTVNIKKAMLEKMFPKDGADTPEIRFAGFSGAWERRKLNELMSFSNGINAPKENYGKGRKMISVMDILSHEFLTYANIRNSVHISKQIEVKNKVEFGDLVFVRSSETPEEVGWAKAYLDKDYALFSGFSIRGKKKEEFDAIFVERSLNGVCRKQIEKKAGGSTRYNVSQEILNLVLIQVPSLVEQVRIGSFFKQLDEAVILHQRELAKLQNIKKSLLEKMFV